MTTTNLPYLTDYDPQIIDDPKRNRKFRVGTIFEQVLERDSRYRMTGIIIEIEKDYKSENYSEITDKLIRGVRVYWLNNNWCGNYGLKTHGYGAEDWLKDDDITIWSY